MAGPAFPFRLRFHEPPLAVIGTPWLVHRGGINANVAAVWVAGRGPFGGNILRNNARTTRDDEEKS